MPRAMVVVVVVLTGCGVPMGLDGGVDLRPRRELRVLTRERVVTPAGLEVKTANDRVAWWQEEQGPQESIERDSEGAHVFRDVPEGPAMIQVGNNTFFYTGGERVEICADSARGGISAGVQLDVMLAQPAAPGDTLRVSSSELGADQPLFSLGAGTVTAQENLISWRTSELLVGQVTLTHHVREDAGAFSRTVATGILDAGHFTQTASDIVTLTGAFTPLARASEASILWDGASLAALGAVEGPVTFTARRGSTRLATVEGERGEVGPAPLVLPALEPDSYSVSGQVLVHESATTRAWSSFSWTAPWSDLPEMKLRGAPPADVHFSADGWTLSWTAPEVAPDSYVVILQNWGNPSFPVPMGTFVTDQTSLPLPPDQHLAGMKAQVFAITGSPLSRECTPRPMLAATRARIPAPVVEWKP